MFDGIPTMAAQIEAGRVRALATTALQRDPAAARPADGGGAVPGFAYPVWIGLMMPAATPRPIGERLHAEITRIMTSETGQAAMKRTGAQPLVMTIPEYDAHLAAGDRELGGRGP